MWNLGRSVSEMLSSVGSGLLDAGSGNTQEFVKEYACYPVSFINKDELEKGNKILLPQSALHQLVRMNISWPMLFEMVNPLTDRMTHSGVLEFIAEEGMCYMPYWMMQNLLLKEGDVVRIRNIGLPKGQFVRLQPVTRDFLDVSNPRAVLENALRSYATLTVGDNIIIHYLNSTYEIEVVELKPANAVSIIETDIQVDFQAPKDYVEPPPIFNPPKPDVLPTTESTVPTEPASKLFSGSGVRLDGKAPRLAAPSSNASNALISSSRKSSHHSEADNENVAEPWKQALPGGVRTRNPEYDHMIRQGTAPGILGKVKTRGIASKTSSNNNDDNSSSGSRCCNISSSVGSSTGDASGDNFHLFGGTGKTC